MAGAPTSGVERTRSYREGDEHALVELWNRAHAPYGGHVRRTAEYWRWCILRRPGIEAEDVRILEGPEGMVAHGVVGGGGVVLELAIDPAILGAERERLARQLIGDLEARCRARGEETIQLELPNTDGPLGRVLEAGGFRQEPAESLSLMVLDMPKLLATILRHRQPRFPHGWAPVFVLELAPGSYRYHPEGLLRLVVAPEVDVRVIDEEEAERSVSPAELASRAEEARRSAHAQGFDESAESEVGCRIVTDRSTLSNIIFGRDSFDDALLEGRLRVAHPSQEQDARTLVSLLGLRSSFYTPCADGR